MSYVSIHSLFFTMPITSSINAHPQYPFPLIIPPFFLTAKNKMNKKEYLRGAPTLLQNKKTKNDYKATPLYKKKNENKKDRTPSDNTKKFTNLKRN